MALVEHYQRKGTVVTQKQKLALKLTEKKNKLSELASLESLTTEQRAELDTATRECRDIDSQLTALLLAEPDPTVTATAPAADAEARERLRLRSAFSVGRYLAWSAGKGHLDGIENEYMAAVGSGSKLPISVFEREQRNEQGEPIETRAVTPGVQGGTNQRPITPAVFNRSVAPFLGITMPSAGMGDTAFPVLSTTPASGVGVAAKDAAVNAAAGAFTVSTQQPRRIGATFTLRYEDLARLEGMEESLRTAIMGVVAQELDNQILNGAASAYNTDGEIRGLLAQLTDPSAPAANAETWARYHAALISHLADPWAVDERSVRALVGTSTYKHMAAQFRATESNESFTAYWHRVGGGVRLSGKIAAPASNIQQAVVVRNNPANDQAAVMPTWSAFDLAVRDVYSDADKGQVNIVVHMLVGDVVLLRSNVYVQDSFRLA